MLTDKNSWSIKWNYGDGSSGTTERHVYATAGTFVATATVTDNKGGTGSNPSVAVRRFAIGSVTRSANDPASTAPSTLQVSALSLKVDYVKTTGNKIMLAGTMPVTQGFKPAGSVLALDVGGVSKTFMLLANGTGKNATSSVHVRIKSTKGSVAAQQSPFTVTIKGGDFTGLSSAGLTDANHNGDHTGVPIMLVFNNTLFESNVPVTMQGSAGRTLVAKK